MTKDIANRDDLKQLERWENEGGRVAPLSNLWGSLKKFTKEDNSREGHMIDSRRRQHQLGRLAVQRAEAV